MAHGYLGDGYGTHGEIDPGRGDDHGQRWREDNWRGGGNDWRDRDREGRMMFGDRDDWRDSFNEERWRSQGAASEAYGPGHRHGRFERDDRGKQEQAGFGGYGRYPEGRRSFSANPDDHYRSWRDRHMSELDREYEDYCREREQQFHRDFDEWRRNRGPGSEGQSDALAQKAELELTHERALGEEGNTPSPVGDATLGTNNSENTQTGRARPRR